MKKKTFKFFVINIKVKITYLRCSTDNKILGTPIKTIKIISIIMCLNFYIISGLLKSFFIKNN